MATKANRYRLKLSRLDFVSLVDEPAQPNAKTLLLKRKGAEVEGETHARFIKASDELGLAFFWAFTSTNPDGSAHFDHHGDTIDRDFIKAAMDFMVDGGGAVDEMHDGEARPDARVAFAFPMTPEIAKAFGIETKTTGLMVALKVSDEQLAKLKSGEYTGVSIAGLGTREPVEARKSAEKRYLTDEIAGHQHEVCVYEGGSPWMTDATSAGAMSPHRHTVTRNEAGELVVLADSGHTHTLTEVPKVITVEPETIVVTESKRSMPGVTTSARAAAILSSEMASATAQKNSESSRPATAANVNPLTKETSMNELEELKTKLAEALARIAALESDLSAAKADAELTDEEKAHAAKLDEEEKKRFKALAKSERKAEVQKALAADPVVVTFKGVDYRASMGAHVVELAKSAKEAHEKADAIEVAKMATDTIGKLAGEPATSARAASPPT
jgi:hypothetical protein